MFVIALILRGKREKSSTNISVVLSCNKKKRTTSAHNHVDESQKYHTEYKRPDPRVNAV
jgi:hypothetical protein